MEPIPETAAALASMDPVPGESDDELLEALREAGRQVETIVPDCVGFSLARLDEGLVFTLVATAVVIAGLDAVQYLDDGPCVEAVRDPEPGTVIETNPAEVLSEGKWQVFASAATGLGVGSTLTIPIRDGERVGGSINLYASTADAFVGHHEALADLFGAWATGAVTNADMTFTSRHLARQAPQILADRNRVDTAVGIIASTLETDPPHARERLTRASDLAGVPLHVLAGTIISMFVPGSSD